MNVSDSEKGTQCVNSESWELSELTLSSLRSWKTWVYLNLYSYLFPHHIQRVGAPSSSKMTQLIVALVVPACYPELFPNHFSFSFPFPLTTFFPHESPPRLISASRFSTGLIAPLPLSLHILHVPWRPHYACSPATAWNVSLHLLYLFISHNSLVHHRTTSISTPSLKL